MNSISELLYFKFKLNKKKLSFHLTVDSVT